MLPRKRRDRSLPTRRNAPAFCIRWLNEYAEDALARTEEAVQAALDEVKQQRVRFRTASAEQMQEQRAKLEQKAIQSDDDV